MTALTKVRRKPASVQLLKAQPATRPERMRFTAGQYHQIGASGMIPDGLRTELINGEIIMAPPPDPVHSSSEVRAGELSQSRVPNTVQVRLEQPVHLDDHSEPVPDISVVKRKDYESQHPTPADIHLLIEFSNTTLADDLTTKRDLYARAAIKEYWVVDLSGRQVHAFTKPRAGVYREQRLFLDGDTVKCSAVPSLQLKVNEMLPRKGRK